MKVEIKGLGNFDRIEQPALINTEGWRTYQPSEEIQALDDLGLSAVKTFNFPLVAEKQVNSLPTVEFSYFDPNAEKYVTLKSSPINIEIEGEQLPDMAASPALPSASPVPANQAASHAGRAGYSDGFAGSGFVSSVGRAAGVLDRSSNSGGRAFVARPWALGSKRQDCQSTAPDTES